MVSRTAIALVVFGILIIAAAIAIGLAIGLPKIKDCDDESNDGGKEGRQYESGIGSYRYASVAADHGPCSTIGVDIMARQGGSSVDATIATLLCLGVVNAQHLGVGGGVLMVIYESPNTGGEKELMSVVGREMAPTWAHKDMFKDNVDAYKTGPLSIAVPGEVAGYYAAWEKYGKLPWSDLFQPAIKMCKEGWKVSNSMQLSIASGEEYIRDTPNLSEQFVKSNGDLYKEGDTMKNEKLGVTLETIAKDHREFYVGDLAIDIVEDIKEAGGNITLQDLRVAFGNAYIAETTSVNLKNGDFDVYSTPPPGSGIILNFILNVMDGYNYKPGDIESTAGEVLFYHRMIEAWKFAIARRKRMGDVRFADQEQLDLFESLTEDVYAEEIRQLIDDDRARPLEEYDPDQEQELKLGLSTCHSAILAPDGGAVSVTSTVGSLFGCRVRGSRTGIVFNNGMELFSLPSATNLTANYIFPKKNGRSATSPTMVMDKDGKVALLAGGSGGVRIITATTLVAMRNLWLGFNISDSVEDSRFHHQLDSANTLYHDEMSEDILQGLRDKGHENVTPTAPKYPYLAVVQAIDNQDCIKCGQDCNEECIHSASDWRKGGYPDGY